MSTRPRHHDVEVPLSESLDQAFQRLTQQRNKGRGLTFNNVRYEHLSKRALTYLPTDAEGVVTLAFLDVNHKIQSVAWGIEAVYATMAEALRLARQQKFAVTFDHPPQESTQALPHEDQERIRLLRTSRSLPAGDGEPLSLLREPNATVYEEAMAVKALISSLNHSLFLAYHDDMWPVMDPNEVAALQNSLTTQKLATNVERSEERMRIFGIHPHPRSRPSTR